jgi:hypothetical protein
MFQKILKKISPWEYLSSCSRTSLWRQKKWLVKTRTLYFWLWLAFNIDGSYDTKKEKYNTIIENIKTQLTSQELEFLYIWISKNYKIISKNISIKEVNSKGKLFMHLLYILPYVKENFHWWNIEWFISRILYNCTRSWYTNYCKKRKDESLKERS